MLGLRRHTLVFVGLFFLLGSTATAAIEAGVYFIGPVDTPASSTLDPDAPMVVIKGYGLEGVDLQKELKITAAESGESLPFSVESRRCAEKCRGSFLLCHCGEPGRNCRGEVSVGAVQSECRFTVRLRGRPAERGPVDFRIGEFSTTLTAPGE